MQETIHAVFVVSAPFGPLQSSIRLYGENGLLIIRQELVKTLAFDE
jgi:hypothetical protein